MTQQDVFDRMGVSHSFMSKCESGERVIDIAELWELSKIFAKTAQSFRSR